MQCACAILSSMACPAQQYFSILSHKRHDKKKKEAVFRFSLQRFSEKFSFQEKLSEISWKKYNCLHIQCPLFLSDFNEIRIFSTIFEKHSNIKFRENPSSWSRVVPSGRASGRLTDMTKLTVAFRNFGNAPKNVKFTTAILNIQGEIFLISIRRLMTA